VVEALRKKLPKYQCAECEHPLIYIYGILETRLIWHHWRLKEKNYDPPISMREELYCPYCLRRFAADQEAALKKEYGIEGEEYFKYPPRCLVCERGLWSILGFEGDKCIEHRWKEYRLVFEPPIKGEERLYCPECGVRLPAKVETAFLLYSDKTTWDERYRHWKRTMEEFEIEDLAKLVE